jgi:hypothetical protein
MQLLLPELYLSERGMIDNNVDYKKLSPIIELIQDIYVHPALGTDLFNEIITQSVPPASSLMPDNKFLLDNHILKMMLAYVNVEAPLNFKFRFMNRGLVNLTDDKTQAIDDSNIRYFTESWTQKAQTYKDRMIKYIEANPSKYAAYFTNSTTDDLQPEKQAYKVDLYLPEIKPKESRF